MLTVSKIYNTSSPAIWRSFLPTFTGLIVSWNFATCAAQAELFNSAIDQLPVSERVALKDGNVVVSEVDGTYTARILVEADVSTVWSVLTDYESSQTYAPGVISSTVLSTEGNRSIVEQVSEQQVLFFTFESRLTTENTITSDRRIEFRLIDGNLPSFQGYWQLEPIAPFNGAEPTAVLIEQQILATAPPGVPADIFRDTFKSSLVELLEALAGEVNRRELELQAS